MINALRNYYKTLPDECDFGYDPIKEVDSEISSVSSADTVCM